MGYIARNLVDRKNSGHMQISNCKIELKMKTSIFLILMSLTTSTWADWKVDKTVDAMTDKTSKNTYIISKDGNRFTLMRKSDNKVWGYLKLSGMNQFKINDELMLRVDKNKPHKINNKLQKLMKVRSYEWNPNLLGFLAWHGENDGDCGLVTELMNGKKMVIRYHPNKSTYKDVVFDISKKQVAIEKGLGLTDNSCKNPKFKTLSPVK